MKKITITIENEAGQQVMSMATSIATELLLVDLGAAGSQKKMMEVLCKQAQVPVMSLSLHEESAGTMPYTEIKKPIENAVAGENETAALTNGPIRMDTLRHEVYIDGSKIALTPREYDLLHCFLLHQGHMLTHSDILKEVWGPEHASDTQYLRVYIGQLRNKLEARPGLGKLIVAKAGIGYRMDTSHSSLQAA